jgi:hypothetical protein
MRTHYNVLQALLSLIWGTWFTISGVSILSAEQLRVNPYLKLEFLPYFRFIVSIFLIVDVLAVAVLLRVYQLIDNTDIEIPSIDTRFFNLLKKLAKAFLIFLLFSITMVLPFLASSIFKDVNIFQQMLSGGFLLVLFIYLKIDVRIAQNTERQR